MLVREQGRNIKLLRLESVPGTRRTHQVLVGVFRADTGVPTPLLEKLTPDERLTLLRWLTTHRESRVRAKAQPGLRQAQRQLEAIVTSLDVAADTLSPAAAAGLWIQLQAIARALRRGGHPQPVTPWQPSTQPLGQRDFVDELMPMLPLDHPKRPTK
ncbi:hypothetical protein [Burkholderia alba]|uniref:hypothetical protein n=1 Tax=Burkholderia alba TaxID=2683677 RepID=UPI002B056FDD|nr:hypothetical protein [Burkholderia alba]